MEEIREILQTMAQSTLATTSAAEAVKKAAEEKKSRSRHSKSRRGSLRNPPAPKADGVNNCKVQVYLGGADPFFGKNHGFWIGNIVFYSAEWTSSCTQVQQHSK